MTETEMKTTTVNSEYPIPDSLRPVLIALAKEVLTMQPCDLYTFGAMFFHTLIQVKSETGLDPLVNKDAYSIFQTVLSNEVSRLRLNQQIYNSANLMNSTILEEVTNLTHEINLKEKVKNLSATKIQASVRGYLTRKHLEKMSLMTEPKGVDRSRQRSQSMDTTAASQKAFKPEQAAVMIQAAVRSYLTRKHLEARGVHVPRKI